MHRPKHQSNGPHEQFEIQWLPQEHLGWFDPRTINFPFRGRPVTFSATRRQNPPLIWWYDLSVITLDRSKAYNEHNAQSVCESKTEKAALNKWKAQEESEIKNRGRAN